MSKQRSMGPRWAITAVLLLAVLTAAPIAHAFGTAGHRAVGGIADRLLTNKAKAQVAMLLAQDLDLYEQPSGRTTLLQVANWPDEIRKTDAHEPYWHYDKLQLCKAPPAPVDGKFCGENCASAQIAAKTKILSDPSQPLRERNEALKWLVHLVGDVHQPLHAASNVYMDGETDAKQSKDDRGGNHVPVVIEGYRTRGSLNLHKAWDTAFVDIALKLNQRVSVPGPLLNHLADAARQLDPQSVAKPVVDWVRESHHLARTEAYNFDDFGCREPVDDEVTLSTDYKKQAAKTTKARIILAGARLARLLNEAVGS